MMVSRIPLKDRSCRVCSYYFKGKCLKFNQIIRGNWAKAGCLGFTVEKQTRMIGRLYDPPEGRNINKKEYTYDADDNMETVKCYQDNVLLFTVSLGCSGGDLISQVRVDKKESEVG